MLLSSRFYEMIPHSSFVNQVVPPIDNIDDVKKKERLVDSVHMIETMARLVKGWKKVQ